VKGKRRHFALVVVVLGIITIGVSAYLGFPHLRFWYLFEPLGLNAKG
jgi:hypothetical protein